MGTLHHHPHAAIDRFPQLVRELMNELGAEDIHAVAGRIVEAELGDFCWESRIAELLLGPVEDSFDDDEMGPYEQVGILGYFHSRYHVATCNVDTERRLQWMVRVRYFDDCAEAERAFATMR